MMRSIFQLLVMAPNSWFGQWVNRQQIFSRIGCLHPVLYSTGGWSAWNRHSPHWKKTSAMGSFSSHDNVWVDDSPRFLLHFPKWSLLDNMIFRLQVRRWKKFLRGCGNGPLVAYVYHPMFFPYVKWIGADYLVYHAYDLYDHTPGWDATLDNAERELLKMADLAIASSDQIADVLRKKVPREIRVLPNGADVAAFDREINDLAIDPADLIGIAHPRLGWVGSLHPQVDYRLIFELARRRPAWHFVLVGQIVVHADARADAELAQCQSLPNVHFLGRKRIDEIPLYLSHMDVNLMIYRLSDHSWINSGYPLKLHEYLAAGLPVVSADLPSVRPFSNVVRIADGIDDWQCAITEAIEDGGRGTRDERQAVAAENSWDRRSDLLNAWLSRLAIDGRQAP
jgi:glycosyltransferase involved in cell wall biosynthesis